MKQGQIIVEKAREFLGVKEYPKDSNNVIFNTHYYGKAVSGSAYPWCVTFVWDIFRQCGLSKLFYDGKKTASCDRVYEWGKRTGILWGNYDMVEAGDLVLFDFDGKNGYNHIGIIEKYNNGLLQTIEGNTGTNNDSNGGEVMRRLRNPYPTHACSIRPRYTDTDSTSERLVDETIKARVKIGQKALNEFLKTNISVDGIRGTETRKGCVKCLQTSINKSYNNTLVVDGIIGTKTKSAFKNILLKKGIKNYLVSAVQIVLYCRGYEPRGIDGIFGNGTYNAVVQFQKDNFLKVDGIIGKQTIEKLFT